MKKYNQLSEVGLSHIRPEGWLKDFLKGQADGVPGNLHRIGYPFDRECWQYRSLVDGGYIAWWPYEQTAYWIDAMVRTWILTGDDKLYEQIRYQVERSFQEDGDPFVGPLELKKDEPRNRWPQAVYFRAILALWEKTQDDRYLKRMYAHYMADTQFNYSKGRDCVNVEIMLRLAEVLGGHEGEVLRAKALRIYEKYDAESPKDYYRYSISRQDMHNGAFFGVHGVTLNELGKLPAIVYSHCGDRTYLDACIRLYETIEQKHMLPDGIHSSNELTCGKESHRAHESCVIGDYMWAVGYLLEATGDGKYADRIERACFNALPGAVLPDFRALQYFSCVNQVICTRNSTHLENWRNTPKMAYQPHPYPECCAGNIGRAMPNYIARMYQKTADGYAVSLYGPSVYEDDTVRIEQRSSYPFEDTVCISVEAKQQKKIMLQLRVPAWAKNFTLRKMQGQIVPAVVNGYVSIAVTGKDELMLQFPMEFSSHLSADGGIYYTYGPFTLALQIQENRVVDEEEPRQTKQFPAYNIYPETQWRYAVSGEETPRIVKHDISQNPFWDGVPFEIQIPARKLKNWDFLRCAQSALTNDGGEGQDARQKECGATEILEDLVLTPPIPAKAVPNEALSEEEWITLVPYGCTNLRLTVFPKYRKGVLGL